MKNYSPLDIDKLIECYVADKYVSLMVGMFVVSVIVAIAIIYFK